LVLDVTAFAGWRGVAGASGVGEKLPMGGSLATKMPNLPLACIAETNYGKRKHKNKNLQMPWIKGCVHMYPESPSLTPSQRDTLHRRGIFGDYKNPKIAMELIFGNH